MGNIVPKFKNIFCNDALTSVPHCGTNGEQMSTERLTAEVKTRVPRKVKKRLEALAAERHLGVSDIAREAFRSFLERNQPSAQSADEKAVTA
jgi:hypothetical protein